MLFVPLLFLLERTRTRFKVENPIHKQELVAGRLQLCGDTAQLSFEDTSICSHAMET